MFKKLKKTAIRVGRVVDRKLVLSNCDTSPEDDSLCKLEPDELVLPPGEASNQEIVGEDLGLSPKSWSYSDEDISLGACTSNQSLYTTAIESASFNTTEMDETCVNEADNTLCVTAYENLLQVSSAKDDSESSVDPIEDCLAAFGSMSLASNTPVSSKSMKPSGSASLLSCKTHLTLDESPLNSPYVVFDLDQDGQAVECGTLFNVTKPTASPKINLENVANENTDGDGKVVALEDAKINFTTNDRVDADRKSSSDQESTFGREADVGNILNASSNNDSLTQCNEITYTKLPETSTALLNCQSEEPSNRKFFHAHTSDAGDVLCTISSSTLIMSENMKDLLPRVVEKSVSIASSSVTKLPDKDIAESLLMQQAGDTKKLSSQNQNGDADCEQPSSKLYQKHLGDGDVTQKSSASSEADDTMFYDALEDVENTILTSGEANKSDHAEDSFDEASYLRTSESISSIQSTLNMDDLSGLFSGLKVAATRQQEDDLDQTLTNDPPNDDVITTDTKIALEVPVHIENYAINVSKTDSTNVNPFQTENSSANLVAEMKFIDDNIKNNKLKHTVTDSSQGNNEFVKSDDLDFKTAVSSHPGNQGSHESVLNKHHSEKTNKLENTALVKGAYTLDFDQLDTENFKPFAVKSTVTNSPVKTSTESISVSTAVREDCTSTHVDVHAEDVSTKADMTKKFTEPGLSSSAKLDISLSNFDPLSYKHNDGLSSEEKSNEIQVPDVNKGTASIGSAMNDGEFHQAAENVVINVAESHAVESDLNGRALDNNTSVEHNESSEGFDRSLRKGEYTIDSDKFDDPSFDPFKTSKSLVNDANESVGEARPVGAYSIDLDMCADPNFNPFKTGKGLANCPIFETNTFNVTDISTDIIPVADTIESKIAENDDFKQKSSSEEVVTSPQEKLSSKGNTKTESKIINKPAVDPGNSNVSRKDSHVAVDNISVSKGQHTFDVGNIDDSNFDSMKVNKILSNDDAPNPILDEGVSEGVSAKTDKKLTDRDSESLPESSFSSKPRDDEKLNNDLNEVLREKTNNDLDVDASTEQDRGAYSIDFSKFDDPDFDPFKTTKSLLNDDNLDVSSSNGIDFQDTVVQDKKEHGLTFPLDQTKSDESNESQAAIKETDLEQRIIDGSKTEFKPTEAETADQEPTEVELLDSEPPVSKGAYSIDFSKFDDPNFDPFKTTQGLSNDDDLAAPSYESTYPQDILIPDKKDDLSLSVSQTKHGADNEYQEVEKEKYLEQNTIVGRETDPIIPEAIAMDQKHDEDVPVNSETRVQRGAYSMDFSKFDDANFDPFKTTKNLPNEDSSGTNLPASSSVHAKEIDEQTTVVVKHVEGNGTGTFTNKENVPMKTSKVKKKSASKQKCKSPKAGNTKKKIDEDNEESADTEVLERGGYTIDFRKFDDPNYDPFKTTKGLSNEDALTSQSLVTADINTAEKSKDCSLDAQEVECTTSINEKETTESVEMESQNETSKSSNLFTSTDLNMSEMKSHEEETHCTTSGMPTIVESLQDSPDHKSSIPRGAYSIDFSEFDDPTFDPFKTTKGLPNDDGSSSAVSASSGVEVTIEANQSISMAKESQHEDFTANDGEGNASISSKTVKKPVSKQKRKSKSPKAADTKDDFIEITEKSGHSEPAVPKGAYSIDFSEFDDPNFDPFKTTKGLSNDDDSSSAFSAPSGVEMTIESNQGISTVKESQHEDFTANGGEGNVSINSKTMKKPVSKQKRKFKSPKAADVKVNFAGSAEESGDMEPAVPMEAYSIDFSKFDDPNFDPFKTTKGLSNVDASSSAFLVSSGVEVTIEANQSISMVKESQHEDSTANGGEGNVSISSKTVKKPVSKQKRKSKSPKAADIKDDFIEITEKSGDMEPAVPKGAYSIDFSEFDDPNFDPFKTTKGLSNVDASSSAFSVSSGVEVTIEANQSISMVKESQHEDSTANGGEGNVSISSKTVKKPVSKQKRKSKSPKAADIKDDFIEITEKSGDMEPAVPKGAYSIDFSKFDDPNFDPFKTTKGLSNVDASSSAFSVSSGVEVTIEANQSISTVKESQHEDFTANGGEGNVSINSKTVKKPVSKQKRKSKSPKAADIKVNFAGSAEESGDMEPAVPMEAYSIEFSKFEDPNFDPFKTTKGLLNDDNLSSALCTSQKEKSSKHLLDNDEILSEKEKPDVIMKENEEKSMKEAMKLKKPASNIGTSSKLGDLHPSDDEKPDNAETSIPRGAYSINLSKFDDPNFDPFKTNKGLANDDVSTSSVLSHDVEEDILANILDKTQKDTACDTAGNDGSIGSSSKPKQGLKKVKKPLSLCKTIPKSINTVENGVNISQNVDEDQEIEPSLPQGSYSIDVSKFDDPTFNPFESKNFLTNLSPSMKQSFTIQSEDTGKSKEDDSSSSSSDTMVMGDATDVDSVSCTPQLSPVKRKLQKNELGEEGFTTQEDGFNEQFRPAEEVFSEDGYLKTWEELWDKESQSKAGAIDSDLRKKSLYVQFDPLVQATMAMDRAMQNESTNDATATEQQSNTVLELEKSGSDRSLTKEEIMTAPHFHPASVRIHRNISEDKWNEQEAQEGAVGYNLINFSPGCASNDKLVDTTFIGKTTFSAVKSEVHSTPVDVGKNKEVLEQEKLDEELKHLEIRKQLIGKKIEESKIQHESNLLTSADLEQKVLSLRTILDRKNLERKRILDDIISAKRVYYDYHRKATEMLPVLRAHKEVIDILNLNTKV
ncbi:unnamed protein product [Clavelina lepadiformis]|uniref:Uncharacterized protein n=1 Tax=Clavelina lepadiformis TaxID=159417 RepID=A0ABP0F1F8_CLALP